MVHSFFQEVENLKNEINILSTLKHERIVSFHGSIEQGCHLYLFMDFMAKVKKSNRTKRAVFPREDQSSISIVGECVVPLWSYPG